MIKSKLDASEASKSQFSELITASIPKLYTLMVILVTYIVCFMSKQKYEKSSLLVHLAIGGISGLICLATHYIMSKKK